MEKEELRKLVKENEILAFKVLLFDGLMRKLVRGDDLTENDTILLMILTKDPVIQDIGKGKLDIVGQDTKI